MTAVSLVGGGDLHHRLATGRQMEPLRHLMSQNPVSGGDRAAVIAILAFTGNHQNQTQTIGLGRQDKRDQGRVRFGHGHSVQIDPRLWHQFALGHFAVGLVVHLQRCRAKRIGN